MTSPLEKRGLDQVWCERQVERQTGARAHAGRTVREDVPFVPVCPGQLPFMPAVPA